MKKRRKSRSKKLGLPPGSIIYIGEDKEKNSLLYSFRYNQNTLDEKSSALDTKQFSSDIVQWLNIDGVSDVELVKKIGDKNSISKLILEDVVNTTQGPKLEFHKDTLFVVVKMLTIDEEERIDSEHISFILKDNCLFSFQEKKGDVFEAIRKRLRENSGLVRSKRADYLLYCLLDCIVDHYFVLFDKVQDKIDQMEDKIQEGLDSEDIIDEIYLLKKDLNLLKKPLRPLLEIFKQLLKENNSFIDEDNKRFFRDLEDHSKDIINDLESFRDQLNQIYELKMTMQNNKMSSTLNKLSLLASIFVPLSFVAGLYGMNFEYMPELKIKNGYFYTLGFMGTFALGCFVYFKIKKWF